MDADKVPSDSTSFCDCKGCVCSGWNPPNSTYAHRFALAEGFSGTEQICFERGYGQAEYVILVTDDQWFGNVQWTLEGQVLDGHAHDVRLLDFTTVMPGIALVYT